VTQKGPQLAKKFPTFYGTRRFITAFTTAVPIPSQIKQFHAPVSLVEKPF